MSDALRLRPGLTWRTLGDRIVVLDLDDSVYLSVAGSGSVIWEALGAGSTSTRLVDRVLAEYEVDRDVAVADVDAFVADLKARRLLR